MYSPKDLFSIQNIPSRRRHITKTASSFDRDGGNWDIGNYEEIDGDEGVILDVTGAGAITRIWSANPKGNIRIYIDDSVEPVIDEDFRSFFKSSPLSWGRGTAKNDEEAKKLHGFTTYRVIPFQKRCRVTASPPEDMYYQFTYLIFDEHTPAMDTETAGSEAANMQVLSKLSWPTTTPKGDSVEDTIAIKPGESAVVFDVTEPLVIESIMFEIPFPGTAEADRHIRESLLLRCYWDEDADIRAEVLEDERNAAGEIVDANAIANPNAKKRRPRASIKAPLSYFFMDFGGYDSYEAMPIRKHGNRYECRFPMPVRNRAMIELVNTSCINMDGISFSVRYRLANETDADLHYFSALYHHEDSTFGYDLGNYRDQVMYLRNQSGDENYTILDTRGAGHFVGCCFEVDFAETQFPRSICESDEAVFVDDDPTQTSWGTGLEDYINDAWGMHNIITPLHGGKATKSTMYGYRFHISDAIAFRKHLRFTIEHGSSNNCTAAYRSVAYYYQQPGPPNPFIDGVPERQFDPYFSI